MIRNRLMNLEIMEIRTQRARIRTFAEQAYAEGLITLEQKWDAVRAAIQAEMENKMLPPIGENG